MSRGRPRIGKTMRDEPKIRLQNDPTNPEYPEQTERKRENRKRIERVRNQLWNTLGRIADTNPLWVCWQGEGHSPHREDTPDDLIMFDINENPTLTRWFSRHPEWTVTGKWSHERCAAPVFITDAGRRAIDHRILYDNEPIEPDMPQPHPKEIL